MHFIYDDMLAAPGAHRVVMLSCAGITYTRTHASHYSSEGYLQGTMRQLSSCLVDPGQNGALDVG